MGIFKKDIFEYNMLERVRINIEKKNEKYLKNRTGEDYEYYMQRDYCELILETEEFNFYTYMNYGDGGGGYILRQEKSKKKNIVFFGESQRLNCIFHNFLFQVSEDQAFKLGGITGRDIYTGELYNFDWLSKKTRMVYIHNVGHQYRQDYVDDIFVKDDDLIFNVTRKKSDSKYNQKDDPFDIDTKYKIVVKFVNGCFKATSVFFSPDLRDVTKILNEVNTIKAGNVGALSESDIVNLLINIPDAQKNLSKEQFEKVYNLFLEYSSKNTKIRMDAITYLYFAITIVSKFNKEAPYEKYSGADEKETKKLLTEIKQNDAVIKANGLVCAVRTSIGDVFIDLLGPDAAVFAIVAISSALKHYLEKNANINPLYSNIAKLYVSEIIKFCADTEESINYVHDLILTFSSTFDIRINLVKNNCEGINYIEKCGIAAAALFFNLQKDNIDISDEAIIETYFEMFKTVFIKLVESL